MDYPKVPGHQEKQASDIAKAESQDESITILPDDLFVVKDGTGDICFLFIYFSCKFSSLNYVEPIRC